MISFDLPFPLTSWREYNYIKNFSFAKRELTQLSCNGRTTEHLVIEQLRDESDGHIDSSFISGCHQRTAASRMFAFPLVSRIISSLSDPRFIFTSINKFLL